LHGCLSAKLAGSVATGLSFVVKHTQYEASWYLSTDDKSINEIAIGLFRPVTLADDGLWEIPSIQGTSNIDMEILSKAMQVAMLNNQHASEEEELKGSSELIESEVSVALKKAPSPNIVDFFMRRRHRPASH
jgi:hypothetical protein